jgi:putative ABC transport system substrate-binding protein
VKRRGFAAGTLGAIGCGLALPLLAQPPRLPRLAVLATFGPSVGAVAAQWAAFYAELAARGWSDGRSIVVDARYNEGRPERDAAFAAELLVAQPDLIMCTSSGAVDAARRLTRSVPIVMVGVSHAVEAGFVTSMARPGGNVTGVTNQAGDMQGKFVELLLEVRPDLKRLGVFWSPSNVGSALAFTDAEAAAAAKGVRVVSLPLERAADVEGMLQLAGREGVQALHVHPTPGVGSAWRRIIAWANEHKVVTLGQAVWVRDGFLMSYWAVIPDLYRIAAGFVDRILHGARPADMPVEQPTRFELRVNLKTAKAIGVTLPKSLLLRADEAIE